MNCPVCQKQLAVKSYRGDIHVDECPWCMGVWFDPGEMESYRAAVDEMGGKDLGRPATFQPVPDADRLKCPKCKTNSLTQGMIQEVKLSRCEKCRGVFVLHEQIVEMRQNVRPDQGSDLPLYVLYDILSILIAP